MHHIEIIPTNMTGIDSGRTRYRIVCHTCKVLVHRGTTGPMEMTRGHWHGNPGYERPLREGDPEFKPAAEAEVTDGC